MSGIAGIFADKSGAAAYLYYMLYALQHRGQQSCGIATYNDGLMDYHKDYGLVSEVFKDERVSTLRGNLAIGHVRMASHGEGMDFQYVQPIVAGYKHGALGMVHDGTITNAKKLRNDLQENGYMFQSNLDTEVIATMIVKNYKESMKQAIIDTLDCLMGSYALIIMAQNVMFAARDVYGIKPLSIGKLDGKYVVASETCAFDSIGATFVRDVEPGEVIKISEDKLEVLRAGHPEKRKLGVFEMVYIARPDSIIDGKSIYLSRLNAGKYLAKEHPIDADLVIGAPDSGISFAVGYAEESGIPYTEGIIKNRYVGRTFIQPNQEMRDLGVKIKLNPIKEYINGKRIVLVDDSIVRGTTMKRTVAMLREAGAKEVHVRVGSPMVKYSSNLMMDTPTREELVAAMHTKDEIRDIIGADTLEYISLEALFKAFGGDDFTQGCFTGIFPEGTLYKGE